MDVQKAHDECFSKVMEIIAAGYAEQITGVEKGEIYWKTQALSLTALVSTFFMLAAKEGESILAEEEAKIGEAVDDVINGTEHREDDD